MAENKRPRDPENHEFTGSVVSDNITTNGPGKTSFIKIGMVSNGKFISVVAYRESADAIKMLAPQLKRGTRIKAYCWDLQIITWNGQDGSMKTGFEANANTIAIISQPKVQEETAPAPAKRTRKQKTT